jgi:hypothetical protein
MMTLELQPLELSLSPAEREMARELWASMMPAGSQTQLDAAREALRAAPVAVRNAVITAIVRFWSQRQDAQWGYNPFD